MKKLNHSCSLTLLAFTLGSLSSLAVAEGAAATLSAEKPAVDAAPITAEQCKMGFADIQKQYQSLDEQCSKINYSPEVDSTLLHNEGNADYPDLPE